MLKIYAGIAGFIAATIALVVLMFTSGHIAGFILRGNSQEDIKNLAIVISVSCALCALDVISVMYRWLHRAPYPTK